jgi:hypothetical protein
MLSDPQQYYKLHYRDFGSEQVDWLMDFEQKQKRKTQKKEVITETFS